MCGIVGVYHKNKSPISKTQILRMMKLIEHRGPDAKGHVLYAHSALGHQRLSIIDIKGGKQPMYSSNKRYVIIFNGEIYNFKELRTTLQQQGVRFKTKSDTEVILEGYAKHGTEFFSQLNGMFAFAILDRKEHAIMLCRDRLGIKPLYIYETENVLLFASEIKAFYGHEAFIPQPNPVAIKEYLTFSNLHHNISFFKNVRQLEPACWMKVDSSGIQQQSYWKSTYKKQKHTLAQNAMQYRKTCEGAVERHMISDVALGAYLSGGIDSSSVALLAAKRMKKPLHVFTGTFSETPKYTELKAATAVAKKAKANHHVVNITPKHFLSSIKDIVYALDEPRVGMGAFPQYHVSKLVSKHVTVVLTGHGGDELFAGYPLYKARAIRSWYKHPFTAFRALLGTKPSEMAHIAYYLIYPFFQKEVGYGTFIMYSRSQQKKLFTQKFEKKTHAHDSYSYMRSLIQQRGLDKDDLVQEVYMKTYLPSLFIVEDKVGMAHSIEARTPLCDNEMLDLSMHIPLGEKLAQGTLKAIPKQAARDILPALLYSQPKKGFPTPLSLWFKEPLRAFVEQTLLSQQSLERGIFTEKALRKELQSCFSKKSDGLAAYVQAARVWSLLNIELWHQLFIDGEQEIRRRARI